MGAALPDFPKASYEAGTYALGNGAFAYLQPDGGWGFSNAGLVTDGGEALLIDTMFDFPHTRAMLDGFHAASPAKIRTLVNTHQNGDHWFGNALVEDAEIVATERAASAMAEETPDELAGFMKAAPISASRANISFIASDVSILREPCRNFPTRHSPAASRAPSVRKPSS